MQAGWLGDGGLAGCVGWAVGGWLATLGRGWLVWLVWFVSGWLGRACFPPSFFRSFVRSFCWGGVGWLGRGWLVGWFGCFGWLGSFCGLVGLVGWLVGLTCFLLSFFPAFPPFLLTVVDGDDAGASSLDSSDDEDEDDPVKKGGEDPVKSAEATPSGAGSRSSSEDHFSFIEIYVTKHGHNLQARQRAQIILTLLICGVTDLDELLEVDHAMLNDVCAQHENLSHMHKMRTRQFLERQALTHAGFERFAVHTPSTSEGSHHLASTLRTEEAGASSSSSATEFRGPPCDRVTNGIPHKVKRRVDCSLCGALHTHCPTSYGLTKMKIRSTCNCGLEGCGYALCSGCRRRAGRCNCKRSSPKKRKVRQ